MSQPTLSLPRAEFVAVPMSAFHSVLYNTLRLEAVQAIEMTLRGECPPQTAVRSIARLSSAATLPKETLFKVVGGIDEAPVALKHLVEDVASEGISGKLMAACSITRSTAASGRKIIVWSVLSEAIEGLAELLSDIAPLAVCRATPPALRADRLREFRESSCRTILILDPRVCPEEIRFHEFCRESMYLDRSYNIEQYRRSLRAACGEGSPCDAETRVRVLQTADRHAGGSIDHSVGRQLLKKIGSKVSVHANGVSPDDLLSIQHHLSGGIAPEPNEQI